MTPHAAAVHPEELTMENIFFIGFKQRQSVPSLSLSIYLSVVNYSSWQENLTITTVKVVKNILISCRWFFALFQNVAKPVTELSFPSVTICSPGLNMEAVEEAILEDFDEWLKANSKDDKSFQDQLSVFMEEKYARTPTDGSIFDQIKAMNSPHLPSEESEGCKNCGSSQALHQLGCLPGERASQEEEIFRW